MAQQTQATESTHPQEGSDVDVMTADGGSTLYNRPDARVASSDALQWFHKVLVVGPDARSQVRTPPMQIWVWVELGFLKPI